MESRKKDVYYYAYNPCYVLEEALKAMIKCLGFETEPTEDSSSLEHKDDQVLAGTSTQDTSLISEQVADTPSTSDPDPPSATTDPEADDLHSNTETFGLAASIMAVRVPPRPPISGSRIGPQTN
ncbi:hypothetical protein F2P56_011889 [Juglans regia]|uniref:Uncharacterized protein n=1 Tax=Juglans regia TaxID=51240 RepID=A0A833XI09_JUGRE|nr:hypothetical protein F2P56_011889 [Juglans regia]